jgi:hypothetical protein
MAAMTCPAWLKVDASEMLWLRSRLVLALYDFAASWNKPDKSKEWREVCDPNLCSNRLFFFSLGQRYP